MIYSELGTLLHCDGFHQVQYSIWACDNIDVVDAYWLMLGLLDARPPSKLESTIKGLSLHHVSDWVFNVTDEIQVGGAYSPRLRGPTPAGLVPPDVPAALPPLPWWPPLHTQQSEPAMNVANWRV